MNRVSAEVKRNGYSLPFEIKAFLQHKYNGEIDTILKNIPDLDKVSKHELLTIKNKITEKLKLDYLSTFNQKIVYSNVLLIHNKGRKEIKDIKVSSEMLTGYYQYLDNDINAYWGVFSPADPFTIDKITGKSTITVTIFGDSYITLRDDIKISNSDFVIHPRILYLVKGFLGYLLSDDPSSKIMRILILILLVLMSILYLGSKLEK